MSLSCGLKWTTAEITTFKAVKKTCGGKMKSPQYIATTEDKQNVLETALELMESHYIQQI